MSHHANRTFRKPASSSKLKNYKQYLEEAAKLNPEIYKPLSLENNMSWSAWRKKITKNQQGDERYNFNKGT